MLSLTDSLSNLFVAGGPTVIRRAAAGVDWKLLDETIATPGREQADPKSRRASAVELIGRLFGAEYVVWIDKTADGQWLFEHEQGSSHDQIEPLREAALTAAQACPESARASRFSIDGQRQVVISRVQPAGGNASLLAAVVEANANLSLVSAVLRLMALDCLADTPVEPQPHQDVDGWVSAAVLGLAVRMAGAADATAGAKLLADLVRQHLAVDRVAVGLVKHPSMTVRMAALSDVARVDRHTEAAALVEDCLAQSLSQPRLVMWSSLTASTQSADAASSAEPATSGLESWPKLADRWKTRELSALQLTDRDGEVVAVCLLAGEHPLSPTDECFLTLLGQMAGPLLRALDRGTLREWLNVLRRKLPAWLSGWRAAALIAVISAPFIYPWHSYTPCSVVLEPQAHRLVAAPFEGVFNRSLVMPGDQVQAGQLLGEMEGRELRTRLAALTADMARSAKSRDSNLASGKLAAAQIDRLQCERIEHERAVLSQRLSKLEIRSPIAGIVVSGDLRRNEGATVKLGQSLYEVAPLERVVAEIAIPEEDLELVSSGAAVTMRLDAAPGKGWQGNVERVHPRAEQRDNRQVFVAETTLDNDSGELRPGMKGTATITGPRAPGLWLLIRKPINIARRFLGW